MRIVVHGQQSFGHAVLEKLLEKKEDVVAVCVAPDKAGRPVDPLKQLALENDLPVHQPSSWKSAESQALMQSFEADVCMMAYVLLFVPKAILDAPTFGSFQYHPSLLPMHRGPSSINWPIAMGSTRTGLSIFWPDDGLDEGPILMQKFCDIGTDETLGDIYFKKLFPMGVDAMIESLELVKQGTAPKIEQSLDQGSYESWFGKQQAKLDWAASNQSVYNIIRASNPQPGGWTTQNGIEMRVYDSELSSDEGLPGEVLSVNDNGIVVATGSGSVRIKRVRVDGDKISATEHANNSGLDVGDRLGK